MKRVGAFEAKTHLSGLLDQVARGETFEITRRGYPVARLGPIPREADEELGLGSLVDWAQHIRAQSKPGGSSLKSLVEEGRR